MPHRGTISPLKGSIVNAPTDAPTDGTNPIAIALTALSILTRPDIGITVGSSLGKQTLNVFPSSRAPYSINPCGQGIDTPAPTPAPPPMAEGINNSANTALIISGLSCKKETRIFK